MPCSTSLRSVDHYPHIDCGVRWLPELDSLRPKATPAKTGCRGPMPRLAEALPPRFAGAGV